MKGQEKILYYIINLRIKKLLLSFIKNDGTSNLSYAIYEKYKCLIIKVERLLFGTARWLKEYDILSDNGCGHSCSAKIVFVLSIAESTSDENPLSFRQVALNKFPQVWLEYAHLVPVCSLQEFAWKKKKQINWNYNSFVYLNFRAT